MKGFARAGKCFSESRRPWAPSHLTPGLTLIVYRYTLNEVIRSFRDSETEQLFADQFSRRFQSIEKTARRKLYQLHQARSLRDLSGLPGNRLEMLSGDRAGQYSIRINSQFRVCFVWLEGDAEEVEITDYH